MISSRVPARERIVQVRYKQTKPGGSGRNECERASHNQQAGYSKGFWDDDEAERSGDVTNRGFPPQRNKSSKGRHTVTVSSSP